MPEHGEHSVRYCFVVRVILECLDEERPQAGAFEVDFVLWGIEELPDGWR